MSQEIARTVRIENETDYNTLAQMDAEQRDLSGVELPSREDVENGKPTPKATGERFAIVDEAGADWFLRRLADIEAEKARISANTKKRMEELATDAERLQSLFGDQFKAFCQSEATRRRRKTVTFPNGSGVFRTQPAKYIMHDGEKAFEHARTAHPDFIIEQTTVRLDTAAYLKEAERTGEMLPGLDSVPERETFKIDVAASKGKEVQRE